MKYIGIVDDNPNYREHVKALVLEVVKQEQVEIEVLTFSNAQNLLYELEDGVDFELFILDIEMEGMNGMELARKIRENDEAAFIVFVTSYSEFALDGYDVSAYQYILKDKMDEKLPEVLSEILRQGEDGNEEYYCITKGSVIEKFKISDLIWFYKEGKNTIFVTKRGEFWQRITANEVLLQIPEEQFVMIERGRGVNIRCILKIVKNEVVLSSGETLPISRANVTKVKEKVTRYWGQHI